MYNLEDKYYRKIVENMIRPFVVAFIMILLGIITMVIILIFIFIYMQPHVDISRIFFTLLGIGILTYFAIYIYRKKYIIYNYGIAREVHIYSDRFYFITPTKKTMTVKYERIGGILSIDKDPHGLIFYYDENLQRCNYLYLSHYFIQHILKAYKNWTKTYGKKPCYIVTGRASRKEIEKFYKIIWRLEKSRFCKGARYL